MEEENPIKEYLFEYIKKSETKFQGLFSKEKYDEVIENILNSCYDRVIQEKKEENLGIFSTGILHYMLTNAMINSQRKVEFQGIELDIVIPNLETLEKDSKKTLIIYIPQTLDKKIIDKKLQQLNTIQPESKNIWLVLSEDLNFENKTFLIKKGGNFKNIIFDIAKFVNVQGNNKFKILRI